MDEKTFALINQNNKNNGYSYTYPVPSSSMNASLSCSTQKPDWAAHKAKYNHEFFRQALKADNGQVIYVQTRYVVLYNREDQKPSIACIKDNHRTINLVCSFQNTDQINKCPNTKLYPFKPLLGNMLIQFLPLNEDEITVEYIKINTPYMDDNSPCDDAASKGGVKSGVLNIYLGECKSSILGQAQMPGNCAFVDWRTVGGFRFPGRLNNYGLGMTLLHESFHTFGLCHTFQDDICNRVGAYTDLPEQIQPNFNGELFQQADGTWEGRGDNRYNDRLYNTNSSCLKVQANPSSEPNESFMNVMDYAGDKQIVGFSKSQALMARTYLTGSENASLKITTGDQVINPNGSGTLTVSDQDFNGSVSPISNGGSGFDVGNGTNTTTTLSTAGIVGISAGALVAACLIGLGIYVAVKKSKKKTS
jgi:hypothetical protein